MNALSQRPIGVFDSGVGGLSVLEKLTRRLPGEDVVYLGDTLHMPYGAKDADELFELVARNLRWLIDEQGIKLLVVACNTADTTLSPNCYPDREPLDFPELPVLGPVEPVCRWVAGSGLAKVGVMATVATVDSRLYPATLGALNPDIAVRQIPARGMARLIETGEARGLAFELYLEELLRPLVRWEMDAMILGCTHYAHIREAIGRRIPENVQILDPADFLAEAVAERLAACDLSSPKSSGGSQTFFVTGEPDAFSAVARNHLALSHLRLDTVACVDTEVPSNSSPRG